MEYIQSTEPIKVSGTVVASYGSKCALDVEASAHVGIVLSAGYCSCAYANSPFCPAGDDPALGCPVSTFISDGHP